VAPAGTPEAVIDRWRGEVARIAATRDVMQRLETLGFVPVASTPDQFSIRIRAEIAKWSKVVRDANIRAD
jgi:tripartite-type tricarboxylate transporter receptor subunit TctC